MIIKPKKNQKSKPVVKKVDKRNKRKATEKIVHKKAASEESTRVYHVAKREDGMWQVKFANGQRAIKLFNTQAEAIVFAKKLAKSQLGSIRIHSLKGRIRKTI